MTNPNEKKNYREVRQDNYTDSNGNIHTNVTRTSETVDHNRVEPNTYQSGYVHGRVSERNYQERRLAVDEENTSRGLLLGLLLALTAGLVGIAVWYFNQRDEPVDTIVTPTVTVTPTQPPEANQTPQPQTTIIERTTEVPVLIPAPEQNASPATTPINPPTPNINITVPPEPPAARRDSSSSVTPSNPQATTTPTTPQTGTSTITPSAEQNQTDSTSDVNSPSTESQP